MLNWPLEIHFLFCWLPHYRRGEECGWAQVWGLFDQKRRNWHLSRAVIKHMFFSSWSLHYPVSEIILETGEHRLIFIWEALYGEWVHCVCSYFIFIFNVKVWWYCLYVFVDHLYFSTGWHNMQVLYFIKLTFHIQ